MASGHCCTFAFSPGAWREAGVVGEPPIGQVWSNVGEVADGIESVELAGAGERVGDGRPVAAAIFVGAKKEVVLPSDGDGRMERSARLLSIGRKPVSVYTMRASQMVRA